MTTFEQLELGGGDNLLAFSDERLVGRFAKQWAKGPFSCFIRVLGVRTLVEVDWIPHSIVWMTRMDRYQRRNA